MKTHMDTEEDFDYGPEALAVFRLILPDHLFRKLADYSLKEQLGIRKRQEGEEAIAEARKGKRETLMEIQSLLKQASSPVQETTQHLFPEGFPSEHKGQLIALFNQGLLPKACQLSKIAEFLTPYNGWGDEKTKAILDDKLGTLRREGKLGSIKINRNNKLVWWLVPSCIDRDSDKILGIKGEYLSLITALEPGSRYEIKIGKETKEGTM